MRCGALGTLGMLGMLGCAGHAALCHAVLRWAWWAGYMLGLLGAPLARCLGTQPPGECQPVLGARVLPFMPLPPPCATTPAPAAALSADDRGGFKTTRQLMEPVIEEMQEAAAGEDDGFRAVRGGLGVRCPGPGAHAAPGAACKGLLARLVVALLRPCCHSPAPP